MKRIFAILLATVMLAAMAVVPASAATTFSVDITNTAAEVYVGDTIEVFFEVDDVIGEAELAEVDFYVNFDPAVLQATYNQTNPNANDRILETPTDDEWEQIIDSTKSENGTYHVSLIAFEMGYDYDNDCANDACVGEGETLRMSLPFVVIGEVGDEVEITVTAVWGADGNDYSLSTIIDGTGDTYTATIAETKLPVTTLGAKINTNTPALRLGAKYERAYLGDIAVEDVIDLGIVFYPTRLLGDAELNLETEGAASVSARAIIGYDPEKTFVDYESFEFYVTIVEIPFNGMDDEISFRAFVKDAETTIYAEDTLSRSYEYVYNVNFPSIGSGEGDSVIYPGTGWFE